MSWSLKIQNGDLALGSASYGTVTGSHKLVQDLRCYLLEHIGTDPLHPDYGSMLDGGRLPDGTEVPGYIGMQNDNFTMTEINAEIRRIVNQYQALQLDRARSDRNIYGKATFTKGEVLLGVSAIEFENNMDSLNITIGLITGDDTNPDLELTI